MSTSLPRPPRQCGGGCHTPTTNPTGRCDACNAVANHAHNAERRYYHTKEWAKLRKACLARDYDQCVHCADTTRLTAHHIRARRDGGLDELDNLVTLCGRCHSDLEIGSRSVSDALADHLRITRRPGA